MKNWLGKDNIKEFLIKTLILVGILALIGVMIICVLRYESIGKWLNKLFKILMPFIYGLIIAYLLNPLNSNIEKSIALIRNKKSKRCKGIAVVSVAVTEVFFIILLLAVGSLIIPQVSISIRDIAVALPNAFDNLEKIVNSAVNEHAWLRNIVGEDFAELQDKLSLYVNSNIKINIEALATNVALSISNIVQTVFNFILGIIISVLLLLNKKQFVNGSKKILYAIFGNKVSSAILNETRVADRMFSKFFIGKLLDSLIIGILTFIILIVLQIPYALLVAVIVGITNIIPFFGPFIGAVPSTIIILSADPVKALIFLVVIIVIQQFDGNILGPKLIGNSTGLNTFWVLFSILVFGGLFGIVGMVIGVPLMAVIHDIINKIVNKLLEKRQIKIDDIK